MCTRKIISFACAFLIGVAVSRAQAGSASGCTMPAGNSSGINRPVLGFVPFQHPLGVRALLGVPGAAVYGDDLPVPTDATRIHMAPGRPYALLERPDQETSVLELAASESKPPAPIRAALQVSDHVAFSPNGRSVVLVSGAVRRFQVVACLPDRPVVIREGDTVAVQGSVISAAVSDDGASVLLSTNEAVFLASPEGVGLVVNVTEGAGMAFFPNTGNAAIVDRASGAVYLLRRDGGQKLTPLAALGARVQGIDLSSDGQVLYVAGQNAPIVWSITIANGQVQPVALPVSALVFRRLCGRDAFLLSAGSHQPAWLFLAQGAGGISMFVPAPAGDAPQGGAAIPAR